MENQVLYISSKVTISSNFRVLYQRPDIYLLDDPLSALDLNVARQLFHECVGQNMVQIFVKHNQVEHSQAWFQWYFTDSISKCIFLEVLFFSAGSNFIDPSSVGYSWQCVSTGSGICIVRDQAIAWTNFGPLHRQTYFIRPQWIMCTTDNLSLISVH